MAIKTNDGFSIGSVAPIDSRLVLTLEEMAAMDDAIMPDTYLAMCQTDKSLYLYNKQNEKLETTGRFRAFEGGGSDESWSGHQAAWNALSTEEKSKYKVVYFDDDYEVPDNLKNNNLLDSSTNEVGYIAATGKETVHYGFQHSKLIQVEPNTQYIFYYFIPVITGNSFTRIHKYTKNNVWVEQIVPQQSVSGKNIIKFKTDSTTNYIKVSYPINVRYNILVKDDLENYCEYLSLNKIGYETFSGAVGKSIAFFGGSVCKNAFDSDVFSNALFNATQAASITNYAISGAGWIQGTNILTQLSTALGQSTIPDTYVFWTSTNDYTNNQPIGYISDESTTDTVIGSMKKAVELIREKNSKAIILFTTPIRCFSSEAGYLDDPYIDDVTPFVRYSDAIQMVASYYGIPVYDLWNCSGIDYLNYTARMSDKIHPLLNAYAELSKSFAMFVANSHDASGNKTKKMSNVFHKLKEEDIYDTSAFALHSVASLQWKIMDGICYVNGSIKILRDLATSGIPLCKIPQQADGSVMQQVVGLGRTTRDILYGYITSDSYLCLSNTNSTNLDAQGYRLSFSYPVKY